MVQVREFVKEMIIHIRILRVSGKLQISWQSDNTTVYEGWKAQIKCTGSNTCPTHTLTYNTTSNCSGTASNAPASVNASGTVVSNVTPTCSLLPYFTGWNTSQDGSGTSYSAGENISLLRNDITLYAQYSECEEHIIANGNGETYNVPFCSYAYESDSIPRSSYSQMIYTKDQIIASGFTERGLIKKICFDYVGTDP